jgi:hypothetical protein
VPRETKPDCPFPRQLDLVTQGDHGRVSIAVPIDVPFGEVSRLLQAQFAGKTFPEDGSSAVLATIKEAKVVASGDRLLIELLVRVKKSGLFALGADATVYVWGHPALDADRQILRFTDVTLDVQSAAAFGLLGMAAEAAAPYLQKMLADKAVIDLSHLPRMQKSASPRRSAILPPKATGCAPVSASTTFGLPGSPMTAIRCASSPMPMAASALRSLHWRCSRFPTRCARRASPPGEGTPA